MRKLLIPFAIAVLAVATLPLLVAAQPAGDDHIVVRTDDGHRVVIRGDDFSREDWEDFESAMEELGDSLGSMFDHLDLDFDVDFDDGHGHAFDGGQSFERLGERMSRLGERLSQRFGRWDGDHGIDANVSNDWNDFGERLSDRIERQVNRHVADSVQRDVARAMGLATRDLGDWTDDGDLSASDARGLRHHLQRQMRQLQRQMERLQERLNELDEE